MTQEEKDAILSLRQQQYSFSAIAETTGLSLDTIKSFLSRVSGKKEATAPVPIPDITVDHTRCRQCGHHWISQNTGGCDPSVHELKDRGA